jgi:hypothetical protein
MKFYKGNLLNKHCRIVTSLFISFLLISCVRINTFVPQGGQLGSEVEIFGSGFSSQTNQNEVTFGQITANVLSASHEHLTVKVPQGVLRAKIKVSRSGYGSAESKTDFIPLPYYIQYKEFNSPTLGITQGYWIMYPPGFSQAGRRFPVIYALHGYNFARNPISAGTGNLLENLGLTNLGGTNEHSWVFGVNRAGVYLPFIARSMMESSTANELRSKLRNQLVAVAGALDLQNVDEVVESIIHYLPSNPDSWLPNIDEMIIVMPDGDNSWYTDRLGPPAGRNQQGLGAESSFPTSSSANPANRFDQNVTGWYEQYIMQDLIQQVEITDIGVNKLVNENKRRFIMGISMGGYGSLKLVLKNPAKFVAAASLSGSPVMSDENLHLKNQFLPEMLDVFGSAPLPFGANRNEVEANVQLDSNHISENNPRQIAESLSQIDPHFFLEIGENDILDSFGGGPIQDVQDFIIYLRNKGVSVGGGIVPASSGNVPENGNAEHSPEFWRTRLAGVLKFFSDVY